MKKNLRKSFLYGNHEGINGDESRIYGDCSRIFGDVSGIKGNVSGVKGDCSAIHGYLDRCEISEEDRKRGVNILDLVGSNGKELNK